MTRVALVTQGYRTAGGVRTVARWLEQQLRGAGLAVDVHDLASSHMDPLSRRLARPTSWRTGPRRERADDGVTSWGADAVELEPFRYAPRKGLTEALAEYDLVQVVSGTPAVALAATHCGRPVVAQVATRVAWERESLLGRSNGPELLMRRLNCAVVGALEPVAVRAVDHVMVENRRMEGFVRGSGQESVSLAPPGVDVDRFTPNAAGWQRGGPLVSLCRLGDPRKRLDRLVRSYATFRRDTGDLRPLVIAGKGALPPEVRALITELHLDDHVEVMTDLDDAAVLSLLQSASLFLQTSHEEGLGLSCIEAMACGLPIVATRTAGSESCGEGTDAVALVDQDREEALPTHMAAAMAAQLNATDLSAQARESAVERFSSNVTLATFLRTYDDLLAGRR